MAVIAIGADSNQLLEFKDVFRMRYLGLIDPSSTVYNAWRVPDPTAPYPQDYIVDQQGMVAYWNDQFDPQEVTEVIDWLLAVPVRELVQPASPRLARRPATFVHGTVEMNHGSAGVLLDPCGRVVADLRSGPNDMRDPCPGVYFVHPEPRDGEARKIVIPR